MSADESDVIRKPPRLDRGVISVVVLFGAISGSLWLGYWFNDQKSAAEMATANKLAQIERIFSERANLEAASAKAEAASLRLEIRESRAEILAAIAKSGERVSMMQREMKAWVTEFSARNQELVVPKFGE